MLFLTGCGSKVKYHEPKFYEFNIEKVELDPIEPISAKEHVDFLDENKTTVVMPTWFYLKLLDQSELKNHYILAYQTLYEWAYEDIERYKAFVEKQKAFFRNKNSQPP